MKKYAIQVAGVLFLIFGVSQTSFGQEKKGKFADQIIIGVATSSFSDRGNENINFAFDERSIVTNASIRLNKYFHLGAEYRFISTIGSTTEIVNEHNLTNYNMFGVFTQIDVLHRKRFRVFGQLSYDRGNYCGCIDTEDPFKVEGLNYLGWGTGVNYRIHKYVSLDASFMYDYVLNPGEYEPYAYAYWALGVNYDLDRSLISK